jgi:hypothetical protein
VPTDSVPVEALFLACKLLLSHCVLHSFSLHAVARRERETEKGREREKIQKNELWVILVLSLETIYFHSIESILLS